MTALHPRVLAAAGILGLGALVLSACSSSSSAPTAQASSSASSSASGAARSSAYTDCLSQHGVTLPSGRPGGGGFGGRSGGARPSGSFSARPRPTGSFSRQPGARPSGGFGGGGFGFGGASANPSMQAAIKACASDRPTGAAGGFGGGFGGGGGFNTTALAAFTSCMKTHGITVSPSTGPRALNTTDPKTAAAYAVCKVLLPTPGGSGAPAPTASPTS